MGGYCGDDAVLWVNGDLGPCYRTAVLSSPLILCMAGFALHRFITPAAPAAAASRLSRVCWLDKLRICLLLVLAAVEPVFVLYAHHSDEEDNNNKTTTTTAPSEYLDALVWTAAPVIFLALGVVLPEAVRGQRESLFSKLYAVLCLASRAGIWLADLKDKRDTTALTTYRAFFSLALTTVAAFCVACLARPTAAAQEEEAPDGLHERLLSHDPEKTKAVPSSPEEHAGWFSLLTFTWMQPIMSASTLRASLTMADVYPLREDDSSEQLQQRFVRALQQDDKNKSLIRALYASGAITPFLLAAPLKLVYDLLVFFAPSYLLRQFIEFISLERAEHDPVWWQSRGCHLALALFSVAAIQTFVLQQYFALVFRAGMRVRASLVAVMYDKALRLSAHASSDQQQQSSSSSTATANTANLVSTDASRIQDLFAYLHVIWSSPFQIVLCMLLLSRELGWVSAGVSFGLIAVIVFGVTKILSDKQKAMNQVLMRSKDARVKKTLEMLNSVKLIKLYGMERIFKQGILSARQGELALLRHYVIVSTCNKMVSGITPFVVLVSTLGTFVALGGELDPPTAFVSVTLLQLLRFPMNMLPHLLGGLIEGLNSLRRIESYLVLDELTPQQQGEEEDDNVAVRLRGTYMWGKNASAAAALVDVDFTVQQGHFCIVRGAVGSGKTALLLGLLGELEPSSSDPTCALRTLRGTVSYAAQTPWIRNATIRDNILLGELFEEDFYLQVLDAACLGPDLAQLANGDLTDIGEKGINLSGGQKARISLARCLYSRSDVLLLESVFEAVDEHVQGEIWRRAFFGLLRGGTCLSKAGRRRTVVIVTHCVKPETRLVDQVVRMEAGGRLRAVGREEELPVASPSPVPTASQEEEDEAPPPPPASATTPHPARPASTAPLLSVTAAAGKSSLIQAERATTTEQESRAFRLYISALGGWAVIASQLLVASLRTANDIGSSKWLAHWSNEVEHGRDRELWYYLGIYSAFAVVAVVMFACMFLSIYLASLKASAVLHQQLVDSIVRAPMAFFDSTPLGRITQRFTKDLNSLDMVLPPIVITLYQVTFDALGTVLVVAIVSPLFLFALPFMAVAYMKIKTIYVRASRELKNLDSISLSPVLSQFSEVGGGDGSVVSIRAFGKTGSFLHEHHSTLDRNLGAYYLMMSANRWLAVRIEFIGNFLLLFASMLTASKHGEVSAAMAGMALSYTMNITQSLNWVVRTLGDFETNIVSVERIHEYASDIPQEREGGDEGVALPASWPEGGEIEFQNVSVKYRPELDDVLKSVSFRIPAGKHVGCVGQTGCGKSTVLLALLRILEPHAGRVLVDGVDTSQVSLERLRNAMSIIPQDAVMFQNTLRFNLDPAGVKDDLELWRVLDSCELSAFVRHTFGSSGLLDTVVSGHEFSFGQRQLFCIARALLRNTRILLSDEASSGIDRDTDAKLRSMIQKEFASVTTLTIAHRLETIAQSDLVLVLDFGRVVEFDSPANLMRNTQSKFASLVNEMHQNAKA